MIYCKLWLNVLIGLLLYTRIYGQLALNMPEVGNYGEETHMNCTEASFNITHGYTWYKNTSLIYDNKNGDATGKYTSTHGNGFFTLTITNTVVNDAGEYVCYYNFVPKSGTLKIQAQGTTTAKLSSSNQMEFTFKQIYPNTTSANITCDSKNLTGSFVSSVADGDRFTCIWQSLKTFSTLPSSCSASVELISVIIIEEIAITAPTEEDKNKCDTKCETVAGVGGVICIGIGWTVFALNLFKKKDFTLKELDPDKDGSFGFETFPPSTSTSISVTFNNQTTETSVTPDRPANVVKSVTPNGPAALQGIKPGDTIVSINGKKTKGKSHQEIKAMFETFGFSISLKIKENDFTLKELDPDKDGSFGFETFPPSTSTSVTFNNQTAVTTVIPDRPANVVESVTPNGPAARHGIKPGDTIVSINGKKTKGKSHQEIKAMLETFGFSISLKIKENEP